MNFKFEKPIVGKIGKQKYKVQLTWSHGEMIADEPEKIGGQSLGPDPGTLLASALAACTLSTLRMYIDRKEWDIAEIKVEVNYYQEQNDNFVTTFERNIYFDNLVSEDQKAKLLIIAGKCPVSKILENKITIATHI